VTLLALALIGLAAGAMASALGIGGGIVFVPALVIVAGFGQQLAEGTSLAVIVPTMAVAAWAHGRRGRVDWPTAFRVGAFGVVGGLAGGALAQIIDDDALRRLFAAFLLLMAIRMLSRTRRTAHREGAGPDP
jgi:uncharacterized membrane protein YfcA